MENKSMGYRARMAVSKIAIEPNVAVLLARMSRDLPMKFTHSLNTAYLAAQLLEVYDFKGDHDDLIRGALLHDVGELEIPYEILSKPGRLTPEEKSRVREHVQYSKDMLETHGFSSMVLDIALHHHERSDGTGYPNGFTSPDIARHSKIIMVCDVYEAMTSDRPQRKGFNMYETIDMMSNMPVSHAILQSIKRCEDT